MARIGGDEFAVVLEHVSNPEALERVAQTIVALATELYSIDGHLIAAAATIGVALRHPLDDQTTNELYMKADTALYAAKHGGKGRFAVFSATH